MTNHEAVAELLKREADAILDVRGLRSLLARYGDPHPHGSYVLNLLVWRDLDIYLVGNEIAIPDFFALGLELMELLSPIRMSFRNERMAQTEGLPDGLYWGVYLVGEEGWKIDLWAISHAAFDRAQAYEHSVASRLTDEARDTILRLKSVYWRNPAYRQTFAAKDIYDAVLDEGVTDEAAFGVYLERRGVHL